MAILAEIPVLVKLLTLAILFVGTGGAVASEWGRHHRLLVVAATIVAIVGSFYLFLDIYGDLKRELLDAVTASGQTSQTTTTAAPSPPPAAPTTVATSTQQAPTPSPQTRQTTAESQQSSAVVNQPAVPPATSPATVTPT